MKELSRKQIILKLIVEDFIVTATPVGSNYLISKYKLPYSSATIRNEMASLEEEGLIEKTHTSSGRVPSAKGYEYYVTNLREECDTNNFKFKIKELIDNGKSIEDVLNYSCKVLSEITHLATFSLGPNEENENLISISLVPINKNSATAIFVTDKGYVENKTFIFKEGDDINEISKCIALLDKRLKGTRISDLVKKTEALRPILSDFLKRYDYVYQSLISTFTQFNRSRSEIYGKRNLLSQPEFKDDPEELKKLFDLFNNPDELTNLINQNNKELLISGDVNEDLSIVTKELANKDTSFGKIAIIGPKRMDYSKVIDYLNAVVSELMENFKIEDSDESNEDNLEGDENGRKGSC